MHVRVLAVVAVLLTGVLWLPSALAALPPMSEEELEKQADLIVVATVQHVGKVGTQRDDHCYTWQDHRATLVVKETRKGTPGKEVAVRYPTIMKNDKDCVGGATSYSLDEGATYEMYLRANADGDFRFISWSGVNEVSAGTPAPQPSAAPSSTPAPSGATPEPAPTPSPTPSAAPTGPVAPAGPGTSPPEAPARNGGCACEVGVSRNGSPNGLAWLALAAVVVGLRRKRASAA